MAETCTERSHNNRPIRRDAQDAAKLGGETLKAMRRLRRRAWHDGEIVFFTVVSENVEGVDMGSIEKEDL
ncbi:MAG TPA: hypothetical protein VI451_04505 [Anaerolineales bacterium]|nr:hypothetical protein [Anaerolineales bacterium]